MNQQEWILEARRVGIPQAYMQAEFATATKTKAIEFAQNYVEADATKGRALLLTGPTGSGKTFAAVAAIRAHVGKSKRLLYFPLLIAALRDFSTSKEALESALHARFLVLDDFCAEYVRGNTQADSLIESIIWHREANLLPTILTTNCTTDQLRAALSDRALDRLAGSWTVRRAVTGPSLRRE